MYTSQEDRYFSINAYLHSIVYKYTRWKHKSNQELGVFYHAMEGKVILCWHKPLHIPPPGCLGTKTLGMYLVYQFPYTCSTIVARISTCTPASQQEKNH